jgi:hypothetical protein
VALFVALKQPQAFPSVPEPTGGGDVPTVARLAHAEGYARRGEFDRARGIAVLPGRFEDRFRALVTVADIAYEANGDTQDISAAVDLLDKELGNRDLPDWSLIRLARLCGRASQTDAAKRLSDLLQKLPGALSPRAQAIRALALLELLRGSPGPVSEADVKAITPPTSLGHLLAWEVLARKTLPSDVSAWPEPARPLGYTGTALGLLDRTK